MVTNLLTDAALRRAKPAERLQRLRDGDGLYLSCFGPTASAGGASTIAMTARTRRLALVSILM